MFNNNYYRAKAAHAAKIRAAQEAKIRAATQNALRQAPKITEPIGKLPTAAMPSITPSVAQLEKQIADQILKAQQVEAMAGSKANMSDITFKRLFGNTRDAAKRWWGGLSKAKKFGIGGGVGALGLGALGLGAYGLGAFDSPERELTVWEKLGLA